MFFLCGLLFFQGRSHVANQPDDTIPSIPMYGLLLCISRFCLIGKSKVSKNAVKRLLLAAFAPAALRCQEYNIRIYCVDDTQDALENVIELEKKCGGVMMDCCKLMHFKDNQDSGLRLTLTELSMGWRCKLSNHQQVIINIPKGGLESGVGPSLPLEKSRMKLISEELKPGNFLLSIAQ